MTKFKKKEQDRVKQLSNRDLYEEFKGLYGGDCYDAGCFTNLGYTQYKILEKEIELRLREWFDVK